MPDSSSSPEPEVRSSPLAAVVPAQPHSRWTLSRGLITFPVLFLVPFLFLRSAALEPYGVPTGSMAPALIGNHRDAPCPRCGAAVRVGIPSHGVPAGLFTSAKCGNCGKEGIDLSQTRDVNGDRLLVDKNVFGWRPPRRWEVAVFRCPDPHDLNQAYVKRVIGLPGERIEIIGGDVYADGELLRKSISEVRETRLLEFDLGHEPQPMGWADRWLITPTHLDPRLPIASQREPLPADETVLRDRTLILGASANPQMEISAEYRNWNLDSRKEEPIRAWNSYEGTPKPFNGMPLAYDYSLACRIRVTEVPASGLFRCSLSDGADCVTAELPVGVAATGIPNLRRVENASPQSHLISGAAPTVGLTLKNGGSYLVELAFVDRRVTLAVDGRVILGPVDLPAARSPRRQAGEPPPSSPRTGVSRPLRLSARGCRVVVEELRLYRDGYYTAAGRHGTESPARLGPTEYYVLGDNSGNSEDSRFWSNPGVPEGAFIGKPILVHQPLRTGRVNVGGSERTFQTLDWSRLRIVH